MALQVKGFSKKGKNFYNIATMLTEPIHSMYAAAPHGVLLPSLACM